MVAQQLGHQGAVSHLHQQKYYQSLSMLAVYTIIQRLHYDMQTT
jgi:hypothetical protein